MQNSIFIFVSILLTNCIVFQFSLMRYTNNSNAFKDLIIDSLAITTGILVTENDLINIAHKNQALGFPDFIYSKDIVPVTMRAEELEECILYFRKSLGNIPDTKDSTGILVKQANYFIKNNINIGLLSDALSEAMKILKPAYINTKEVEDFVFEKTGIDRLYIQAYFLMLGNMQERQSMDFHPNIREHLDKKWDGVLSLKLLFNSEAIPSSPDKYFDQRFIAYLKENESDLTSIYWRNFERLVTEFFKRHDYHVKLGPGSKDGGVDIRVWSDINSADGPPLILIQCKRYSEDNLVTIESVKALYTDVEFEKAEFGLIATTSRITPEGDNIISARGYPIKKSEFNEIKNMVYDLWRNPPKY